jgi:hypothetical protein
MAHFEQSLMVEISSIEKRKTNYDKKNDKKEVVIIVKIKRIVSIPTH